jgi:hypothetical protein
MMKWLEKIRTVPISEKDVTEFLLYMLIGFEIAHHIHCM